MNRHSDAVDAVLAAFSNHLATGTVRPTLEHLDPHPLDVPFVLAIGVRAVAELEPDELAAP